MSYYGDIRLGDTIDIKFTTRQISGAPFTLAGSPVISAYPANSTTQITAGITLSVDFDSVTGLNNVRVAATGGNGYLTATNYELVITTGTVNSVSVVGEVIGSFSIENRSALMPTTAGRTITVDANGNISIATNLKKNTAFAAFQFMMTTTDPTSSISTPATGKTVTCTRAIGAGAFGAGTLANVAETGAGIYTVDFGAGDLNGNCITLRCTAAGCDDTFERIITFT